MKPPKKWYRLAIVAEVCLTFIALAALRVPIEAYLPLGLVGVTALGGYLTDSFKKSQT